MTGCALPKPPVTQTPPSALPADEEGSRQPPGSPGLCGPKSHLLRRCHPLQASGLSCGFVALTHDSVTQGILREQESTAIYLGHEQLRFKKNITQVLSQFFRFPENPLIPHIL